MQPLDHLTLSAADFAASSAFYDAALGALGLVRLGELVDEEEDQPEVEAIGWGMPDSSALLWLVGGEPGTTGLHVRFAADSRAQVEAFHGRAIQAGGRTHTAPRRWALYRRGEFTAIVSDPQGNLIEATAPE